MRHQLTGFSLFLCGVLLLSITSCGVIGGRTFVVFDNQSQCGTISYKLTNMNNSKLLEGSIEMGKKVEVEIEPDTAYTYEVDFTAAGRQPNGNLCTQKSSGQVLVPRGQSQTFTLQSQVVTPQLVVTRTPVPVVPPQ